MERMINRRPVWYLKSKNPRSLTCNVASDLDVARLIILLNLKRFAGILSSLINTYFRWGFLFGESLRYHMEVWDIKTPLWFSPKRSTPYFDFLICF